MEINETQENSEIANDFFREMNKGDIVSLGSYLTFLQQSLLFLKHIHN